MAQQMRERRQRILEATRELIGERGFGGVTMRDLAHRSRVSVPTLYNQFGSKDALLAMAVGEHLRGTLGGGEQPAGTGYERVLAILRGIGREMTRLPEYHRALIRAFMSTRGTASLQAGLTGQLSQVLEGALDEMARDGELMAWASPRVLAQRLTAACVAAATTWALGQLDDAALCAALAYGPSLLLLAVARGKARDALERTAREAQPALEDPAPTLLHLQTGS